MSRGIEPVRSLRRAAQGWQGAVQELRSKKELRGFPASYPRNLSVTSRTEGDMRTIASAFTALLAMPIPAWAQVPIVSDLTIVSPDFDAGTATVTWTIQD